jgi:hypothetical protein
MKTLILFLGMCASAQGDTIVWSVPQPDISGAVGSITGWGFRLDIGVSPLYVVADSSSYTRDTGLGSQVGYSYDFGLFAPEIIGINGGFTGGFTADSDSPWTQGFSWSSFTGVRGFQVCSAGDSNPDCAGVDPTVGAVEHGTLTINYSFADISPDLWGGAAPGTVTQDSVNFLVSITVDQGQSSAPEPGTMVLLAGALIAMIGRVLNRSGGFAAQSRQSLPYGRGSDLECLVFADAYRTPRC